MHVCVSLCLDSSIIANEERQINTLLNPFVQMRLPRSGLHVFPVDSCPTNLSEVEAASHRLNCSDIREHEYVYHCVPRHDLSHLVEFCYDAISGWVGPGNDTIQSMTY